MARARSLRVSVVFAFGALGGLPTALPFGSAAAHAAELAYHPLAASCAWVSGPLDGAITVLARGACGVPQSASAVMVRLRASTTSASGELAAFAAGATPVGGVLTYSPSNPVPSTALAVVALNPIACGATPNCGDVRLRTFGGAVQFSAEIEGYFEPHASHHGQTWTGSAWPALELAGPDANLELRNTNDVLGGFLGDSWSTVQLGLFNPSSISIGRVGPLSKRAFFGSSADGRVGSLAGNFGSPFFRNLLDLGDGRAVIRGELDARQLPRAAFDRRENPPDRADRVVNTLTIRIPAPGFVVLTATISSTDATPNVALRDEAGNFLTQSGGGCPTHPFAGIPCTKLVAWVVPVSPGTRTFRTTVIDLNGGGGGLDEATLSAVFHSRTLGTAFLQQ
jgi:hypothetical protein